MNCYICEGKLVSLGTVPFERNSVNVPIVDDTPMEYYRCINCDFVCCPEMLSWSSKDLGFKIYNADYIKYDPDYTGARSKNYAQNLIASFKTNVRSIKHLDYGSGGGSLSQELNKSGWNSKFYDPYASPKRPAGKFHLITAIEVFEHALDINTTIKDIKSLLNIDSGVILFSTLFADETTTIDWWYIMARNGHIGMLSEKSMKILANKNNLYFSSLNSNLHVLQTTKNNLQDLIEGIHNGGFKR